MSEKIKILVVSTSGLRLKEGISTVVLDYLRRFDPERFDLSIVAQGQYSADLAAEFEAAGIRVVPMPERKENTLRYVCSLLGLMRREKYNAIYVHGSSAIMSIELGVAWLCGCKVRAAHCHSTGCEHRKADRLLRPLFYHLYTDALACGTDAGNWLFPGRPFRIMKNGRSVPQYRYDPEVRERTRRELGVGENTLVVGHVGTFTENKNQTFTVHLFQELLKLRPDARLYLIGGGELWEQVRQLAAPLGDRVVFTGMIGNVPEMLQAMDVMLLPSFYEGLPLVIVEWQIAALPCLVSDRVTRECAYSDGVYFQPLEDPSAWARRLLEIAENDRLAAAEKTPALTIENGYDIDDNARQLQNFFAERSAKG